jgi:predicted enzyme related to lactoylglutathione lyase
MGAFPMKMDRPNSSGAIVKMDGVKAGGNSILVYFDSEDCAVEEARVSNAEEKYSKIKCQLESMDLCQFVLTRKEISLVCIQ